MFYFFPQKICFGKCFFFPGKVRTAHTHTQFQRADQKKTGPKKKTPFLLTHTIFSKKWSFLNFPEIKKYGTFGETLLKNVRLQIYTRNPFEI